MGFAPLSPHTRPLAWPESPCDRQTALAARAIGNAGTKLRTISKYNCRGGLTAAIGACRCREPFDASQPCPWLWRTPGFALAKHAGFVGGMCQTTQTTSCPVAGLYCFRCHGKDWRTRGCSVDPGRGRVSRVSLGPPNRRAWREPSFVPQAWNVMVKVNDAPIYNLRHTYATFQLGEGVDHFALARNMGTTPKMPDKVYGHTSNRMTAGELTETRERRINQLPCDWFCRVSTAGSAPDL